MTITMNTDKVINNDSHSSELWWRLLIWWGKLRTPVCLGPPHPYGVNDLICLGWKRLGNIFHDSYIFFKDFFLILVNGDLLVGSNKSNFMYIIICTTKLPSQLKNHRWMDLLCYVGPIKLVKVLITSSFSWNLLQKIIHYLVWFYVLFIVIVVKIRFLSKVPSHSDDEK